jgi:hypothetical protein
MVRCADCGFLCVRSNDNELVEVPDFIRQDWESDGLRFWQRHHNTPICFARVMPVNERQETGSKAFVQRVCKGRECPKFAPWQQGSTPKEHQEMLSIESQRAWEQERRERDRAWQEEQRKEDQQRRRQDLEWQSRQEKSAEDRWQKEHRFQRKQLLIVGIVGTVVLAIAQIVAALIQVFWQK